MSRPSKKDLTKYVTAAEAAKQLRAIADELEGRSSLVRFYVNLWFHDEPREGQPKPEISTLSRSWAS